MTAASGIKLLMREAIDIARWNECIDAAPNGLIYAKAWYLDAICTAWCALVLDDYKAVMPLPWRSKWGFRYVYTPFFLPVLDIFCKVDTAISNNLFLEKLSHIFDYCCLEMDTPAVAELPKGWKQVQRMNLVVPPAAAQYSRLSLRKTAMAVDAQLAIEEGVSAESVVHTYFQAYYFTHKVIPKSSYQNLIRACNDAPAGSVHTLAAHLPQQRYAAFYILLSDEKNTYSLLGGSTEKGKAAGAFYALTSTAVQHAMDSDKTFRFEGSDIPGVAFFNRQFGAQPMPYVQLRLNKLPWPLRLLKR